MRRVLIPESLPHSRYVAIRKSPNSVSLLLMPFSLNYMMVKGFTSITCIRIDGGSGCGVGSSGVGNCKTCTPSS